MNSQQLLREAEAELALRHELLCVYVPREARVEPVGADAGGGEYHGEGAVGGELRGGAGGGGEALGAPVLGLVGVVVAAAVSGNESMDYF